MRFKFLGTEQCPDAITFRGVEFEKGKSVSVDEDMAVKLVNLDYFERVKPGRKPKDDQDAD